MQNLLIWIYLVSFLDLFAVSLLIPLMSAHLKELGASHFAMGCMTSAYALSQMISGPVIGSWSDRIGRQKILIFCLLAVSCCYTAMGFINSLILMALLRSVAGVFKHAQVLVRTIVSDKIPENQQTQVSGYLKAVASISFTLGPAIGGNLAELHNGFQYVCCCAGTLFILNSGIVYFFLNDARDSDDKFEATTGRKMKEPSGSIVDAIRDLAKVDWPLYGNAFALKFLMDFSAGAFHNNYGLKLREKFDITPKAASYTISFQSFVATLAIFFVGAVNKRFYRGDDNYERRNLHSYALMTIAYLGIAATDRLHVFMLWTVLLKSIQMFLRIIFSEMIINLCPFDQRGSVLGSVNSISNIARLVTPLISGLIEDAWGSNCANLVAATAAALGVLVSTRIASETRSKSD